MAYGMTRGHFISTIKANDLPFDIIIVADPAVRGHALMCQVLDFPSIIGCLEEFIKCARSPVKFCVAGYMVYSKRVGTNQSNVTFDVTTLPFLKCTGVVMGSMPSSSVSMMHLSSLWVSPSLGQVTER